MKSGNITQRLETAESPCLPLGLEEHKEKWCSQSLCSLVTKINGVSTRTAVSIITSPSLQEARGTHSLYTTGPQECEVMCKCCCLWVLVEPWRAVSAGSVTQSRKKKKNGSPFCLPSFSHPLNYQEASWEESLFCRFLTL